MELTTNLSPSHEPCNSLMGHDGALEEQKEKLAKKLDICARDDSKVNVDTF